ncbi:glycosyltransferase family 117 protein [Chryseobacterium sp. A321]
MKNWTFKTWNTVLGWGVFGVSLLTYFLTMERKFSFWDTGEYISSAVKLEVTHAPGAALFQLVGAVFAMFALGDGANYSLVINAMSALFSALTILFLFWTVTHLLSRIISKENATLSLNQQITILFSGLVGSLAFAFSDTFWFSAVEGEVYSMASLFLALILWLITKWESQYGEKGNERWLILIAFTVGLSVGVHMMAMLVIPAVCLIYYTRNYEFSWKSFLYANLITLGVLIFVFKLIFPAVMSLFGKIEIFTVNGLGLPFHSGTLIAFLLLLGGGYFVLKFARKKSSLVQTSALSVVFMIIGFSCWLVIPIRANANPPMNLNNPDNAIGMLDYYNRVQYGDWPIFKGQNYTQALDFDGMAKNEDGSYKQNKTGDVYEKDESTNSYRKVGERFNYVYSPEHISLMPRMFNDDKDVMANYISMYGAPDFTFNFDNPDYADSQEAHQIFDELRAKYESGEITVDDYLQIKPYNLINVQRPSFDQNLDYFITFQNGYYFVRYLMWNFVGRQNDLEGHMENNRGNWISGISFIDNALWGSQDKVPAKYKNESTVAFFFLPLLLGLLGMYFQLNKDFGRFYAILALFVLTSVGIIFYTGVKPFEPRERDYAMVGSFYAFALWIGLGAGAILFELQKKVKSKAALLVGGVVLLGVPAMMGFQNYASHDRSGRSTAYDFAYSTLKSLPENGILFVYGDNDTYPVWAIQETERFRDDVKVVNFTLLSTPWNIDQVKRRTYNSMPIPSTLTHAEYREGVNDQIYVMQKEMWQELLNDPGARGLSSAEMQEFQKFKDMDSMPIKEALAFFKQKSPGKDAILKLLFGDSKYERFNILPVSKLVIPVNKQNVLKSGIVKPQDQDKIVSEITIDYTRTNLFKNNLMLLDILANFDWKRPISFSTGGVYDNENIFYLNEYLQYDGFSYRLVPIHTPASGTGEMGRVDGESLYSIVKNYRWGNFKDLSVHFDETCTQNIIGYRNSVARASEALVKSGQKAKAVELLDLASKEIPVKKYNDPRSLSTLVYGYILAGQDQKGLALAEDLIKGIFDEYDYYTSLSKEEQRFAGRALRTKPLEYSMVISAVSEGYEARGESKKAYDYLVKGLTPIDKRYSTLMKDLEAMGKQKAYSEADKLQNIIPFYHYLFEAFKPYDSTFGPERLKQIETQLMQVTQ